MYFLDYFQGVHVMKGFDVAEFMKSNVPKSFFYGTFIIRLSYSRKNEILGCTIIIVEIKPPVQGAF